MYKFRIVIDVTENENGLNQETTISASEDGNYNRTIALGALEVAKLDISDEIQKE